MKYIVVTAVRSHIVADDIDTAIITSLAVARELASLVIGKSTQAYEIEPLCVIDIQDDEDDEHSLECSSV